MRVVVVFVAVYAVCAVFVACEGATPRLTKLGTFSQEHAAFVEIASVGGKDALLISAFTGNPFGKQTISVVPNIGDDLANFTDTTGTELTDKISWPNLVSVVPQGAVAGFLQGYVAANGFLVPGFSVGGINLIATDSTGTSVQSITKVSTDKGNKLLDGYFYHMALWHDMNGDGLLDIVTARATKPILGKEGGDFLWLEQPASNPLSGQPWTEHVLCTGPSPSLSPDVFFTAYDLDQDGNDEFLFASFFSGGGFGVVYSEVTGADRWAPANVKVAVIDTGLPLLNGFALEVVDVNGDGNMDVLFTNHVNNATSKGAVSMVVAFEIPPPSQPFSDASNWKHHILTEGFVIREAGGATQAAPGFARAVYPQVSDKSGKPVIALEGDGDQRVYILVPASTDPTDWTYQRLLIHDCQGTAGSVTVGDVNGDGYSEIFAGCYDKSEVVGFTFGSP